MSDPGPSQVAKQEHTDEMVKFYGEMTDAVLVVHSKAVMTEVTRRNALKQTPLLALATPPVLCSQDTDELPRFRFLDPKDEFTDEQYLVVHERASGVEYHPETSSYTWNPRLMDTDGIRRTNELNNYGRATLPNKQKKDPPPPPVPSSSSSGTRNKRAAAKTTPIATSKAKSAVKKSEDPRVECSCSICNARFTSIRVLLKHRGEKHSTQVMLTCHFCDQTFPSRNIFNHLCQEYKVFQCAVCLYAFASEWHREKHRCDGVPVVVPVADAPPMEVKRELEDPEYDEVEPEKESTVQSCGKCGKKYTSTWWFEQHVEACAGAAPPSPSKTVGLKLTCEICLRVYTCPYWYGRHKEMCNPDTPTPAVVLPQKATPTKATRCKSCGKQFQHEISLGYHARYCSVKVILPSLLMPKLKDNTVEEEEEEEEAEEMTTVASDLREEEKEDDAMEEEEEEEDEEEDDNSGPRMKIQCSLCKLECSGVANLLSHRKNLHGMAAMLTCGICDKECRSLSSIRRHVSQEYKIFLCKKCGRNCQERSALLAHDCSKPYTIRAPHQSRLQHGAALKCTSCHASFATSTLLYNHRMTCELLQQHAKRHSPVSSTKRMVSVDRLPSVGGSRPGTRSGATSRSKTGATGSQDSAPPGCIVVKMSSATSGSMSHGSTTKSTAGATSGSKNSESTAGASSKSKDGATSVFTFPSKAVVTPGSTSESKNSEFAACATSGSLTGATGSSIKSMAGATSESALSASSGSTAVSTADFKKESISGATSGATSASSSGATASMTGATSGSTTKSMAGATSGSTSTVKTAATSGATGSMLGSIVGATGSMPGSIVGATGITLASDSDATRFANGPISGSLLRSIIGANSKATSGSSPGSTVGATSGTTFVSMNPGPAPPLPRTLKRTRAQSVYTPKQKAVEADPEKIERWKCSKCDKVFNNTYHLHFHERDCGLPGKGAEPK